MTGHGGDHPLVEEIYFHVGEVEGVNLSNSSDNAVDSDILASIEVLDKEEIEEKNEEVEKCLQILEARKDIKEKVLEHEKLLNIGEDRETILKVTGESMNQLTRITSSAAEAFEETGESLDGLAEHVEGSEKQELIKLRNRLEKGEEEYRELHKRSLKAWQKST